VGRLAALSADIATRGAIESGRCRCCGQTLCGRLGNRGAGHMQLRHEDVAKTSEGGLKCSGSDWEVRRVCVAGDIRDPLRIERDAVPLVLITSPEVGGVQQRTAVDAEGAGKGVAAFGIGTAARRLECIGRDREIQRQGLAAYRDDSIRRDGDVVTVVAAPETAPM
jgi:hypothetical protein